MPPALKKAALRPLEERLQKVLERGELTAGPYISSAVLSRYIDTFISMYLLANENSTTARQFVAQYAFELRKEAYLRFGHDTLETYAVARILKPKVMAKRPVRVDAITHIQGYSRKDDRLSVHQEEAAERIQAVWRAFEKTRVATSGNLGGGRRSSAGNPIDSMDEALWKHWKTVYTPWYDRVKNVAVARMGVARVTVAQVIFKVLVEDLYPEEVDGACALPKGEALRGLKAGLNLYGGEKHGNHSGS